MNWKTEREADVETHDVIRELIRRPDTRPEWVKRAEEKTLPAKELAR